MGTIENIVIEIFDIGLKRWVCHETETLIPVSNIETVLYRSRGVSEGKGMSDEQDRLANYGKPRKRPADFSARSTDRSVRPRLDSERPKVPQISPAVPASASSTQVSASATNISQTTLQSTSIPSAPKSTSVNATTRNAMPHPWDMSIDPVLKTRRKESDEDSSGSELDREPETNCASDNLVDVIASNGMPEPATKKAPWPFKYVNAMAEGFDAMDSMPGTIPQRFGAAFLGIAWKRTCWNRHFKFWKHATEDERARYINAGKSAGGQWRAFINEVNKRIETEAEEIILQHEDVAGSDNDGLLDDGLPDSGRLGFNDPHVDSLCCYCENTLPAAPSNTLLELKKSLSNVMRSKARQSWQVISALTEFCARHKAEACLESRPAGSKWPAHIDFANLGAHVEALAPQLQAVWLDPRDNNFYKSVMLQIGCLGMDKAFDHRGDFAAAEIATVG